MASLPHRPEVPQRWLKMGDARRYSGLGRNLLQNLGDDGTIVCGRTPGGHRVFDRESIDAYLARGRVEAVAILRSLGL